MAARLTERDSDHATRARHARTHAPKNPRIAPTTMKTLPSGRLDFCMNGAFAVLGTVGVGMVAPATVGRSDKWKIEPVEEEPAGVEEVEELMEIPPVRL